MSKCLDYVRLYITGDGYGASSAQISYRVCMQGDEEMGKLVTLEVDAPVFTQSVDNFFDGYVSYIETLEGIS